MIKKVSMVLAAGLMLFLAACGSTQAATTGQQAAGTPMPAQGQMTTESKLLIGTFKLEGTDQAVTKEQAVTLLPLWKAVKSLTNSSTSSQEEVQALYTQIKDSMTADQVTAIDAMDLTPQVMMDEMQKLGITSFAGPITGATPSADQLATRQALRQAGSSNNRAGGPGDGPGGAGGPPPGGGFDGGGGGPQGQSGSTNATPAAGQAARRMGGLNPELLNALIKLLTERAG
jgi:hypothetical protein